VDHDLNWSITIGENIKKISWGYEIESWESDSLGVHEFIKSFLTNIQIDLDFFEAREYGRLSTEVKGFLVLETVS
jgi:hypothetical protein